MRLLKNIRFPHRKPKTTDVPTSLLREGGLRRVARALGWTRLDSYIAKKFLTTYIFLIVIIIVIAIVFDFNERIDKLTASAATWQQIIFQYYVNFVPYFANLFSPLFVFISVIFFTSKLTGNSEIIAMKAAGLSFNRMLRPYMVCATLIAGISFVLGCYVIPRGNEEKVAFENVHFRKRNIQTLEATNIQMQVDTGVVAYIGRYDNRTKTGYEFSLDKFENKKLVSHLTAYTIQYDTLADHPYSWSIRNYRIRTLRGNREFISSGVQLDSTILMQPSDFFYLKGQQETLTQPQLAEFIDRQQLRGASGVALFQVEYHKRIAAPFAAFILTLIGVCLSSQKRKGGMGASLGFGLALSFGYILFQSISASFATNNAGMEPAIAAWLPNIVFAVIGYILYKRTPQ